PTMAEMRAECAKLGIGISDPLGYNNGYVLVMREDEARKLGIVTISDLAKHPELTAGIDPEYLGRQDGWRPLTQTYGLQFRKVVSMAHGFVYQALNLGRIDVTDGYGTDGEIIDYKLRVLKDDRTYFPAYYAVFLFRLDTPEKALDAMRKLEGRISDEEMRQMNVQARKPDQYEAVAEQFLEKSGLITPAAARSIPQTSVARKIAGYTLEHLKLVTISMILAVLIGIPLGILSSKPGWLSTIILGTVGTIQTIPSLALLALLVPISFLGISMWTAIVALFLYSLLPIVRNTATGIQNIPAPIRESAAALGLEPRARLFKVYMPMASRTILAGVKVSSVINVGTAALAALIGAGGLGEPMLDGLSRNDASTILQGAIPAAVLAILVQVAFDGLDRVIIPKGVR
ncbi:MAG TPA: glycine betaine ABC transporter substrate-binding protein, partial [Fimbriimonadaceae bacterium]|nr:glycine betaine ABC transporter substrate-binding protein [Fimbriimonadaceae bacterium]